jgi:hypothetical protein
MSAFRLLVLIFISIGATVSAHGGTVEPINSVLRSRATDNGKLVIEFCELGGCQSLGRDDGYSDKEWEEIRSICWQEGHYGMAKRIVSQTLLAIMGTAVGGPTTGMVAASAIGLLSTEAAPNAYLTAGDVLPGVTGEGKFVLSVRNYVDLIDGIRACAEDWNSRQSPTYKKYNNGWARPLG